jgi:hypothetical protein
MRHLLLSLSGVAAAAVVMSASPPARAEDGRLAAAAVALAIYDTVALPADVGWALTGHKVDRGWGMSEAVLGGLQFTVGGILTAICATDSHCKNEAWLPVGIVFTAWTGLMTLHGAVVVATTKETPSTSPSSDGTYTGPKPASAAFAMPFGNGVVSAPQRPMFSMGTPGSSHRVGFSVAPIVGDARTTPVGIGFVGTF